MAGVVNVNDLLREHVVLDLECLDRLYLNGYVPNLQVSGQVVRFLTEHLGNPIPSPALFARIGDRFRAAVTEFADDQRDPRRALQRRTTARPTSCGPTSRPPREPGVVAIGLAQEFQSVFTGSTRATNAGRGQLLVRQGRAAGERLLLLHLGRRVRARLHQAVQLLPVPGQGLAERA